MDTDQGGPTRILGIRIRNTEGNKRFLIQGTDAIIGYLWYMHKIYIVKGGFRNDFSKLQVASYRRFQSLNCHSRVSQSLLEGFLEFVVPVSSFITAAKNS